MSFPYYHSLGHGIYSHKAVHVEGGAGQHMKVVEKAERMFKEYRKMFGDVKPDEVWCVFDCDSDAVTLREAVQAAERRGFHPIYSIQCFELWYVLHFNPLTNAIDKGEYDRQISNFFNIVYKHGTKGMYLMLREHQERAIRAADRLWQEKHQQNRLFEDPITNVHTLVTALNNAYLGLER